MTTLQYLFNIAGITDTTRADLTSIDAERMLKCFQVNAIGPLLVVKNLLEVGLLGKGSTIANMTSKVLLRPCNFPNTAESHPSILVQKSVIISHDASA